MATSVASGATPAIPTPLTGAAISDATWVPCPYRSPSAALLPQSPFAISSGAAVGVSEDERARPSEIEVRRDVGMSGIHPAVDDADGDAATGRVRVARPGADDGHVPLTQAERLRVRCVEHVAVQVVTDRLELALRDRGVDRGRNDDERHDDCDTKNMRVSAYPLFVSRSFLPRHQVQTRSPLP